MVTSLAFMPADLSLQGISGGQHDIAREISGFSEVLLDYRLQIRQ